MLAQIRQKNLFILILIPSFFDLDRNIALWRSRALIHTYFGPNFQRGRFAFYNIDRKIDLYVKGKQKYAYITRPNFIGKFTNYYTVDEKAYGNKKFKALDTNVGKKEQTNKWLAQRNALMLILAEKGHTQEKIARELELKGFKIDRSAIGMAIDSLKKKNPLIEDENE